MSIQDALLEFRSVVQKAKGFLTMAYQQDIDGAYLHDGDTRRFVTEASFLRMFMAWESFVEKCFIKYMCSVPSTRGTLANCYVSPRNAEHAYRIVLGTMRYVDWSNPDIVRRLAELYFDNGEPFRSCFSSIHSDLLDLRTIRNAAAHLSNTVNDQLDALGTRKLGRTCHNITVADLVLAIDPSARTSATVLDSYLGLLDTAADLIARAM